ncbi:TrkA C-terminal domain-containing protein [Clostridium akagii]|uniref:TrkA C-terminal domain-containing protein n=1 Tax=Clostridium akagii TaxID=91623 RepID=UPI00055B0A9B|nr:TrkA C-terminal domain-containing protein [Clostridium akagii]
MILYFLLLCLIFFLIIEIATVMFKLTGLSEEKSRFQVISLLTSSGFTTKESELITQHPSRRKLAQYVMIIGYIGYLTGISFLINIIRTSLSAENILILLGFFIVALFLLKNKIFLRILDNLIEKIILTKPFKSPHKMYKLINRAKGYGVFNITLDEDSPLIGIPLMNSNLKPHKIIILNIDKGNLFIGFPKRDYILENGDNLLLYGKVEEVTKVFNLK